MFKIKPIENEFDYEKALVQLRKLRNSEKGSDNYNQKEILKILIINYENKHYPFGKDNFDKWVNELQENKFAEKKLNEIEEAEIKVENELKFEEKRINVIKQKLKEKHLKQQDLVKIIGSDKSYISQLLHGRKKFTIQIISKLNHFLDIPYELLIPPVESLNDFVYTKVKY